MSCEEHRSRTWVSHQTDISLLLFQARGFTRPLRLIYTVSAPGHLCDPRSQPGWTVLSWQSESVWKQLASVCRVHSTVASLVNQISKEFLLFSWQEKEINRKLQRDFYFFSPDSTSTSRHPFKDCEGQQGHLFIHYTIKESEFKTKIIIYQTSQPQVVFTRRVHTNGPFLWYSQPRIWKFCESSLPMSTTSNFTSSILKQHWNVSILNTNPFTQRSYFEFSPLEQISTDE